MVTLCRVSSSDSCSVRASPGGLPMTNVPAGTSTPSHVTPSPRFSVSVDASLALWAYSATGSLASHMGKRLALWDAAAPIWTSALAPITMANLTVFMSRAYQRNREHGIFTRNHTMHSRVEPGLRASRHHDITKLLAAKA